MDSKDRSSFSDVVKFGSKVVNTFVYYLFYNGEGVGPMPAAITL